MTNGSDLYKVADVASATGISTGTVNRWVKNGKFTPVRQQGRSHLFDKDEYERICAYALGRVGNKRNTSAYRKNVTIKLTSPSIRKVWKSVQEQIDATMRGDIEPLYLNRKGEKLS